MGNRGSGRRKGATGRVIAGRIVLGALSVALIAFVAVLAWAGIRAVQALPHIERAQQLAGELDVRAVVAGDTTQLSQLQSELSAARSLTGGVAWSVAEATPWIGPQFSAARTLTGVLDEVAATGLSTAAAASTGLENLLPRDGRIDLTALGPLNEQVGAALTAVTAARDELATIDPVAVIGPLRDGALQVDNLLAQLQPTLDGAERATALLPTFLGGSGPREHILLLQNNAEWRSLGGIVGSIIQVNADGGRIEFADQVAGSSFRGHDQAVTPLSPDALDVYGDRPARYMQNPTMIPDFAEAAQVARAFWTTQHGGEPTGVISFDPVALSYLLEATGPIQLPTGDVISSDNAVQLLLNDVYLRFTDPAEQDAFFGVAADAIFDALLSGNADPGAAVDAITRAIDERRLLVWSADEAEQAIIADTTVAGELPMSDARSTTFGVYLNDGVGAKLDYYMAAGSQAMWCGAGDASLRVQLQNNAPADIASYPDYMLATSGDLTESGAIRGITRTLTYIYLPAGAELIRVTGTLAPVGQHGGRAVYEWTTDLAPGETAAIDVRVSTTTGPALGLQQTPVINVLDVQAVC